MTVVHCDFESRSDVDLKTCGTGPYFESPRFDALILCYRIDKGEINVWTKGQPYPEDLRRLDARTVYCAHNASFERQAFDVLHRRHQWQRINLDQWRCSMATASALGLPRSLGKLAEALGLPEQKDKTGKDLIRFFSIPRKDGRFNEPEDHPEKFAQFIAYCKKDVEVEEACEARMIPLSVAEQEVYALDQRINQRGLRIDTRSARSALKLIDKAKAALDAEMREATGGAVASCDAVSQLKTWTDGQGVALAGVAKDDILEAFDLEDLPANVRRVLSIRQEAAKSSTRKLVGMLKRVNADDRMRNCFHYHGAGPGRWSSVGVNVNNLPRPRVVYDDADLDLAQLFRAFQTEDPAVLRTLYGDGLGRPLHLVSDSLRSFIWAAPGHDLIAVDYSGIQGAIGAWLGSESWKLQAMREIIADPSLPDLYRRAAAKILNSTTEIITKKHWGRQIGKVSELALTFAGAVSAFVSMAKNYGMKPDTFAGLYPHVWAAATPEMQAKAEKRYATVMRSRKREHSDVLSREGWMACWLIVRGWRQANPKTEAAWGELEDAMRAAIRSPGLKVEALGRVTYLQAKGFLWCRLPSGRCVAYTSPKLKDQVWARTLLAPQEWSEPEVMDREEAEALTLRGKAKIDGATSQKVTALGVDSTTQKLTRYALYGGLATENLCMGIERDILVCGIKNCEAAGYPTVLHCYDENVMEVPASFGSVAEAEKLMLALPDIYDGLPLAAHGYRAKRYRK